MPHYKDVLTLHGFGTASLLLGFLGAVFFWWVPTGIVLCIIGLLAGFIGLASDDRSKAVSRLLIAGMVVCILALVLDSVVAGLGLETVRFHALR
jgi:hypothetical protein